MLKLRNTTMLCAALLALGSCSNSDDLTAVADGEQSLYGAETQFGDSEVEIRLGQGFVSGTATRAVSKDNMQSIDNIGVFGLADKRLTVDGKQLNQNPYPIDWWNPVREATADYPQGVNTSGCILDNMLARKDASASATDASRLHFWQDGKEVHKAYPISKFYKYAFYGYWPYQPDANVTKTDNSVTVHMAIDGYTDVLWGRARSSHENAFSAYYFQSLGDAAEWPDIKLNHMLTRLKFEMLAGKKTEGGVDKSNVTQNLYVTEVRLIGVHKNIELRVADLALEETSDGGLDLYGDALQSARLSLYDADTTHFTLLTEAGKELKTAPVAVPKELDTRVPLGDCLVVYPETSYLVHFVIKRVNADSSEDWFYSEFPLYIQNGKGFKSGYSYTVHVNVNDPQDIVLTASVTPWIDADDEDNPEIYL